MTRGFFFPEIESTWFGTSLSEMIAYFIYFLYKYQNQLLEKRWYIIRTPYKKYSNSTKLIMLD